MRSRATALGHPIHPMLIPFPIAFLTGAAAFDAIGWFGGGPSSWWTTGGHLALAGVVTGLLAGAAGFVDYLFTVPPQSSAKVRATRHMLINLTAIVLFVAAWFIRTDTPAVVVLGIEVIAVAAMGVGGYLGGTLVTRNMIGVDHRYAQAGKWREATVDDVREGANVVVAAADELKVDQMKLVHVGGRRIVIARTEDGHVAFDDRCTHRGGSLAGGVMICGVVQCLWHGSQFDVKTGTARCGPATEGIRTYPVAVQDGKVTLAVPPQA